MDNSTIIFWGIVVIIIAIIAITYHYVNRMKHDAFNITRGDLFEYFRR